MLSFADMAVAITSLFLCIFHCHNNLQIIPPGMEFHHIAPQDGDMDGEIEGSGVDPSSPDLPIWAEVLTFLSSPSPLACDRQTGNMKIRYPCFQIGGFLFFL